MTSEKPNPAVEAREFLEQHKQGALATISQAVAGYPFGSITPYDLDKAGVPIIFISRLSQHFKNLIVDSRASLLVLQRLDDIDPQANSRLTVLCDFAPVKENEVESVKESYFGRHPESPARSLAHDFVFFRGVPVRFRWIGGFGDIRWIDATDYLNCA